METTPRENGKTFAAVDETCILKVEGLDSLLIKLANAGTSCTFTFKGTYDGINYDDLIAFPVSASSGSPVASATAAGIWKANVVGMKFVKVTCSVYGSGSPILFLRAAKGTDVPFFLAGRRVVTKTGLMVVNNTTGSVKLFRVTGAVHILKLYGIVTTVLSSNITAAHWRTDDQTAQIALTLAAGTTLSAAVVGAEIHKSSTVGTALILLNADAARIVETSAQHPQFQPITIVAKNGANTDIELRYTTTNTPATGAIKHFIEYEPLSDDGSIVAL